jgi:hypothetical protein
MLGTEWNPRRQPGGTLLLLLWMLSSELAEEAVAAGCHDRSSSRGGSSGTAATLLPCCRSHPLLLLQPLRSRRQLQSVLLAPTVPLLLWLVRAAILPRSICLAASSSDLSRLLSSPRAAFI